MHKGAILFGVGAETIPNDQDLREAQMRYGANKNFDAIQGAVMPPDMPEDKAEFQIRVMYYIQAETEKWETNTVDLRIEKFSKTKLGKTHTFYIAYPVEREIKVKAIYAMCLATFTIDPQTQNELYGAAVRKLYEDQPSFRMLTDKTGSTEIRHKIRFATVSEKELETKAHSIWIDWLKTQETTLPEEVEKGTAWNTFNCKGYRAKSFFRKAGKIITFVYIQLDGPIQPNIPKITNIILTE